MFVGAYHATVSVVMPVVTMMGSLAAALATELAVQATRNVVFAMSAFVGFLQHILIAEFIAIGRAALAELVLAVHLVVMLVVLFRFIVDLATMLLMLFRYFVAMGHYNVFLS